jgi:polysaccharide deacetylase family protein (PEP-CTERM system associated)
LIPASNEVVNALTIDVEDYFHVTGFERHIPRRTWRDYEPRFERGIRSILEILDRHEIKATFYVLGWIARRYPQLLREIDAAGHELGSHSYWHRQVFRLSPRVFRHDLRRSCRIVEDTIGKPVTTYRAPSFSITKQSLWALDVLADEGILCDSSVVPCAHDRYGIADAPLHAHRVGLSEGALWELPPAVHRCGPFRVPIGGGGYFRLLPLKWITAGLKRWNALRGPFAFYVHPWEFDALQPRLKAGSPLSRLRHYLNLHDTERKFAELVRQFRFGRVADVIAFLGDNTTAPEICYRAG